MPHQHRLHRLTGAFFIGGTLLFALAAGVLSSTFDWPDILREPPDVVLTRCRDGGSGLIWTWFAVAWSYFLLLIPVLLLGRILHDEEQPYIAVATWIGAVSVLASLVGFLRWVFVVPDLAAMYADPAAHGTTREAVVAAYTAQHQFGGALLGEHVGQVLAVGWSALISVAVLRSGVFRPWLGWLGLAASAVYLLNQGDVLATAVPDFPVWDLAGLLGSTLWAGWLLAIGIALMRATPRLISGSRTTATPGPAHRAAE